MRFKEIAPIVLTAVSVVSSVGAVVMAVFDTPKAYDILDNHRLELDPTGETDLLTTQDKIMDYAKGYWRTGALLGLSVATSITSCVIGQKNYKALAATAATLTAAYSKHKDKVKKFIGEEKAKLIDEEVKREMKDMSMTELVWFHDSISDTDFQMTWQDYLMAKLYINRDLNTFGEISLGEAFPEMVKYMEDDSKKFAKHEWFVDELLENYGYPWLEITEEGWNLPGSENTKKDPDLNHGRPTWVIHYGDWPLPPEIAKDYQYIGATSEYTLCK